MTIENLANKAITEYQFSRQTIHYPGLLQIPAAGPLGTPTVFARIHAPYEVEVITWTAKCDGGPPTVPSPINLDSFLNAGGTSLNANRVLLGMTMSGVVPVPIGGGSSGHIFVMSGTYYYGKATAEGPLLTMPLGKMPFETHPATENYFPSVNYAMDIVDPSIPPAYIPPLQRPVRGP